MRSDILRVSKAKGLAEVASPSISDDDRALFQAAVADAVRVEDSRHPLAQGKRPKPAPLPRQRMADEACALRESQLSDMTPDSLLDTDENLSFARTGISSDTLRKLRRGHWSVQAELDLHGLRSDEAREAVVDFIRRCHQNDRRCLRVIHGKGLGSIGREPVLKSKVRAWMMQKNEVLAFCQAPGHAGGSGALLVLLRAYRGPLQN
jgi:DNA-nicking Smr family endonuclease